MTRVRTLALAVVLSVMTAAPARADITAFLGATMTPANRHVSGLAVGFGLVIVGFEFEYASTTDDPQQGAPSLKTGMGNILLQSPVPIDRGGRWCVQIGAFKKADDATALKGKLSQRYHAAKILQFTSPIGEDWLRVRVTDDDKQRAQALMQETHTDAGIFLVRLD